MILFLLIINLIKSYDGNSFAYNVEQLQSSHKCIAIFRTYICIKEFQVDKFCAENKCALNVYSENVDRQIFEILKT